jgi:hypothetical protein
VAIGVEGGPSLTNLVGTGLDEFFHTDIGLTGGVNFMFRIKPTLILKTGIYYTRKGASIPIEITDDVGNKIGQPVDAYLRHYFLKIPLTISYFNSKEKHAFYFGGGVFVGVPLNSKFITPLDISGSTLSTDVSKGYKRADIGIVAGLGYIKKLSTDLSLTIESSYNLGLSDLRNITNGGQKESTRSAEFLLGLSVMFGTQKENQK